MSRNIPVLKSGSTTARLARRVGAVVALPVAALIGVTVVVPVVAASADPSANTWARLRNCESSGNYSINTGNGYYGAYQFDLATWRSVGGTGYPNQAAPGVQDALALKLYRLRGWQPWTCATILGLQEDSDARSGRTSDIHVPGSGGGTAGGGSNGGGSNSGGSNSGGSNSGGSNGGSASSGVPSWPGTYWSRGDHSASLVAWQRRMRSRGASIVADGNFGDSTLAAVDSIQRQNGLPATGLLGPVTWKLAWTGSFHATSNQPSAPAHPTGSSPTSHTAPAMPGPAWFSEWDQSSTIKRFQQQMASRGADLKGATGVFGPITLSAVKQLQARNGLPQTGILGPNTWKLAWTGRY